MLLYTIYVFCIQFSGHWTLGCSKRLTEIPLFITPGSDKNRARLKLKPGPKGRRGLKECLRGFIEKLLTILLFYKEEG